MCTILHYYILVTYHFTIYWKASVEIKVTVMFLHSEVISNELLMGNACRFELWERKQNWIPFRARKQSNSMWCRRDRIADRSVQAKGNPHYVHFIQVLQSLKAEYSQISTSYVSLLTASLAEWLAFLTIV